MAVPKRARSSYLLCFADRSHAQEYARGERRLWVLLPGSSCASSNEESEGSDGGVAPSTPPPPVVRPAQTAVDYDDATALGHRARQHFNASAREARLGRDLLVKALSWSPAVAAHAMRIAGQLEVPPPVVADTAAGVFGAEPTACAEMSVPEGQANGCGDKRVRSSPQAAPIPARSVRRSPGGRVTAGCDAAAGTGQTAQQGPKRRGVLTAAFALTGETDPYDQELEVMRELEMLRVGKPGGPPPPEEW